MVGLEMCGPVAAQGDELPVLEQALLTEAPKILKFAHEQKYQNIGILKFRIRQGEGEPSDRAGVLNRKLPDRLELALILANRPRDPVGIVHAASEVAGTINGANHLTAEGRTKLFEGEYPLAWGRTKVVPDAFLVGVVQIDGDFQTAVVGISAFDRKDSKLRAVTKFTARLTTNELAEVGTSFTTRGLFSGGQVATTNEEREKNAVKEAGQIAALIKTKQARHPLDDVASPIILTVRYDGQNVPIEFRDGGAFVCEPNEGQQVSFVLQRRDASDRNRYGMVLKVNGENTLYRQKDRDLNCTKWILDPGDDPITVKGFQLDDKQIQKFTVLSKSASKPRAIDYGSDVGTISLTVFQPRSSATPPRPSAKILDDNAEDFAILNRGLFPQQTPATLSALKSQLVASAGTRGLIVEGQTEEGATRSVKFDPDPVPIMVATVTYYKP
jgi:hypothetical protein